MSKVQFILSLKDKLAKLPQDEVTERLNFYCEMIEDRIEEGLSEEDAVASIGSAQEIAAQILSEIPDVQTAEQKPKLKKRPKTYVIVLVALGFPIWFSLLVAAAAVAVSLYASAWSVVVSLWAAFGAVIGSAIGAIFSAVYLAFSGKGVTALAMAGAGMAAAGLSVFLFFASSATTKGMVLLTKKIALWLKNLFVKKEGAK